MKKKIGSFEIEVWESPYPIWCFLRVGDVDIKLHHSEISDLKYAVSEIEKAARNALPDNYKEEV